MSPLAGKYLGAEKGGRSLLAKVCKLQEDLEVISLTMDRRVAGKRGVYALHVVSYFCVRK